MNISTLTAAQRLSVNLHLAKWMGLETLVTDKYIGVPTSDGKLNQYINCIFDPFGSLCLYRAQWSDVVVRAAMNGFRPYIDDLDAGMTDSEDYDVVHDNTDAQIRAATMVAIAMATGWELE